MRHGRFMGYGYNGSVILLIILVLVIIIFTMFISDYFRKRGNNSNQKYIAILNERYVRNEINADKYREILMLLEDEESKENAILILKEKYSYGEIDSREFVIKRDDIKRSNKIT